MNIEALRAEILADLDLCINRTENKNLLFYPQFEKTLAKTELFAETVHSGTLLQLITLFRGKMTMWSGLESEVRVDSVFIADLKQLKHFVAGVVG